jgi:hypothetical protein
MATPDEVLAHKARAARARDDRDEQRLQAGRQRAEKKQARRESRRQERAQQAPGFFGSMRFFLWMAVSLLGGVAVIVLLSVGQIEEGSDWLVPAAIGWAAVLPLAWLDARTWRTRLPFPVHGDRRILGSDTTDDSHVPWIEVRVELFVGRSDASAAVEQVLRLLASRANRLHRNDKEANFGGARVWRVDGRVVRGETTLAFWTTRVLEKWLRRDVRFLQRVVRVEQVRVRARYTGDSYRADFD